MSHLRRPKLQKNRPKRRRWGVPLVPSASVALQVVEVALAASEEVVAEPVHTESAVDVEASRLRQL